MDDYTMNYFNALVAKEIAERKARRSALIGLWLNCLFFFLALWWWGTEYHFEIGLDWSALYAFLTFGWGFSVLALVKD